MAPGNTAAQALRIAAARVAAVAAVPAASVAVAAGRDLSHCCWHRGHFSILTFRQTEVFLKIGGLAG